MDIPPPYISEKTSRRRSKISAVMLVTAFREAWRRFPMTVAYVVYVTIWTVINTAFDLYGCTESAGRAVAALWYLGGVGVPLTLAVSLWCEYLKRQPRPYMIAANLLLVADTIYIMCGDSLSNTWFVGRLAIGTALVVAIIFIPSRKVWAWNFANSQVVSLVVAGAFAAAFGVAIGVIFGTVFALFGFDNFKLMFCVQETVGFLIPAIIFLHLIPRLEQAEAMAEGFRATKFQCGTAKFFFLSITVIYMVILYVYGLKILFTWELPRGVVTWSVTGLTGAVLVTMFLLEGVRRSHPDDILTLKATRLLPMAMMPLFVLMSVAVLYRVSQYGLTAPRLYVLTFNVWCYMVFAYIISSRTRRYNGVAISFAVVFLATSILPYANYINLTNHLMRVQLRQALTEMGFSEFPVGEEEFVAAYKELTPSDRSNVESMMKYLDDSDDHSLLEDITDATYYSKGNSYISDYFIEYIVVDTLADDDMPNRLHRFTLESASDFIDIPQGYGAARDMSDSFSGHEFAKDRTSVTVDGVVYAFPIDSLVQLDRKCPFTPIALHPCSGNSDTVYVVREIDIKYREKDWSGKRVISWLLLDGMIFTKK